MTVRVVIEIGILYNLIMRTHVVDYFIIWCQNAFLKLNRSLIVMPPTFAYVQGQPNLHSRIIRSSAGIVKTRG